MSESATAQKAAKVNVGIIGDYDPRSPYHAATTVAIDHAANSLAISCQCTWIPTEQLADEANHWILDPFDALWCAPGSPYKSMDGALRGIRYARENNRPFLAT